MLIVTACPQTPNAASASLSPQTSTSTQSSTQTKAPFPAEVVGSRQAAGSGPSTRAPSFYAEQKVDDQGRLDQAGLGQRRRDAQLNWPRDECTF